MTRLSILVGIGLMLVGAIAYALPQNQEWMALVPAIAGIIMALGGLVAAHDGNTRKHVMHTNALAAVILLVWVCFKMVPDWSTRESHTKFVADLDVLALSAVFLYCSIRSFITARRNRKEEMTNPPMSTGQATKKA